MIRKELPQDFSVINVDRVKLDSKWNYHNVISPYNRLYYIDEGSGEVADAERSLPLEPGFMYLIPHYTLCSLVCFNRLSQYYVHFFENSVKGNALIAVNSSVLKIKANEWDVLCFKRLFEINPNRGINRSDDPKIYEKDIYYKEYQYLNEHQNLSDYLESQGLLMILISSFISAFKINNGLEKVIPEKIVDAMRYILVNLDKPLSVKILAGRAHQNPEYFSRLFEERTGIRPLSFILEKRIERAKHLIATTGATYAEIAEQTGFNSLSNFSRAFKKVSKLSPGQYQRKLKGK